MPALRKQVMGGIRVWLQALPERPEQVPEWQARVLVRQARVLVLAPVQQARVPERPVLLWCYSRC